MVQKAKVLAPKPDDLSSIPGTYTVVRENQLRLAVLWFPHGYQRMHACMCTQANQALIQPTKQRSK